MAKFKVGDKLKWRGAFRASMYTVGKEYEIAKEYRPGCFYVTDDNENVESTRHTWPAEDIETHFDRASPIRIVTSREIAPGTYGIVEVGEAGVYGVPVFISSSCGYSALQLREASKVLAELADALSA
ncbi:hypothetical protein [Mesorhizobium sp.]|uniref:hypothetical protein n=1 Tax=Mesorhizobium sp. TaxID=1871066 RepID=UPI000FE7FD90|nr:hypothetical protein [Mesorhizobium sp.]RWO20640.1 MAG: hypothetical protein EOS09_26330 [Mesorhizobium sp.]